MKTFKEELIELFEKHSAWININIQKNGFEWRPDSVIVEFESSKDNQHNKFHIEVDDGDILGSQSLKRF